MKTIFSKLAILFLLFSVTTNAQEWNWVTTAGWNQSEIAKSISLDANHNSYVVGTFRDSIFSGSNTLYSRGGDDIFIAKYDPFGNLIWAQSGGGSDNDGPYSMGVITDGSGNTYIACRTFNEVIFEQDTLPGILEDVTILKYDSNGNLIYAKLFFSDSYDGASDIDVDSLGNLYIAGGFYNTINFDSITLLGSGYGDIFLVKLDPQGNTIWARKAGGNSYDNSGGIVLDAFGHVFISGYYSGNSMFDTIPLVSSGGDDVFIAKYDTSGNIKWAKGGNGSGQYDCGNRIDVDEQGNIYVLGQFADIISFGSNTLTSHGMSDIFLTKLDQDGNYVWAKGYGGIGDDYGYDIRVVSDGEHFVTGSFSNTALFGSDTLISHGGSDIFVLFLNSNGIIQWSKQTGGPGDDVARGIDTDNSNECFVSGSFSNTVGFDSLSFTSTGSTDLFVGRILVSSTGINSLNTNNAFNIFPNPVLTDGTITIHSDQNKFEGVYYIFDSVGKLLQSENIESGSADHQIKLSSDLSAGIYFIRLLNDCGKSLSARFCVVE